MCRIGGRLRSPGASSGGAVLEIPPLDILPTNPQELSSWGTVPGG